jgi:hypothetical protein
MAKNWLNVKNFDIRSFLPLLASSPRRLKMTQRTREASAKVFGVNINLSEMTTQIEQIEGSEDERS